MKKFIIPLLTAVILVTLIFAGCVPGAAPPPVTPPVTPPAPAEKTNADVPELQDLISRGLVDPNGLQDPFQGLAMKPDGTPYKIATTYWSLNTEVMVNWRGTLEDHLKKAGAEILFNNPNCDSAVQIAFIEDFLAIGGVDALLIHPADQDIMGPTVKKCADAGVDVIFWDSDISGVSPPEDYVCSVFEDAAGDFDTGCKDMGYMLCEQARTTGEPMHCFLEHTCLAHWADRSRTRGLKAGIEECTGPDSVVILDESGSEDLGSPEAGMNITLDAFTADPTYNALFCINGGAPGGIEALGY